MDFGNPFAIFQNRKKNKSSTILEKKQLNNCHHRYRKVCVRAPKPKQIIIEQPAPKQKEPTAQYEVPAKEPEEYKNDNSESEKCDFDDRNTSASDIESDEIDEEKLPVVVNIRKPNKVDRVYRKSIEKKSQTRSRILQTSQYILNKMKRPAITMVSSVGSYLILQQYILPLVNILNPQAFLTSALYSALGSASESFMT